MARPVTFTEVDNVSDIISTNRHRLLFPSIASINAENLTLLYTTVTLPTIGVGQITANYLGKPVMFRGGITSEHTITVEFLENSDGYVVRTLNSWLNVVCNKKTGAGGYKSEYAADAELYVFDSAGEVTHQFTLINIWPYQATLPALGQDSAPFQCSVSFSVDLVDISGAMPTAATGNTGKTETFYNSNMGIDTSSEPIQNQTNSTTSSGRVTLVDFASQFSSLF